MGQTYASRILRCSYLIAHAGDFEDLCCNWKVFVDGWAIYNQLAILRMLNLSNVNQLILFS